MFDQLRRRLARHGLTLTPGEHTTHGYTARWCVTGLEHGPAWFGELAGVAGWCEKFLGDDSEHAPTTRQEPRRDAETLEAA